MENIVKNQKDFFVSYTGTDEQWATWIAGTLENNGYTTIIQAWDFKPGESFVHNMQNALVDYERFIAVLSKKYLESLYCQAEWENAFTKDPTGEKALFIPVRIDNVKPQGLLASRVYIDLFDENEEKAKQKLLNGVSTKGHPRNKPSFPGNKKPLFPGSLILPENNFRFQQNPNFTGRIEKFEEIRRNFTNGKGVSLTQQAIKGMGGIGKSETAKEYAFRFAQEYSCMWWIDADAETGIQTAYRAFALIKKLASDSDTPDVVLLKVKEWLRQKNNWLFIFDNAEKETPLEKYLPASGNGHILITSRYQHWGNIATVDIDLLPEEDAYEFLTKAAGLPTDEYQKELAKELGFLPLALEQAASYIKENFKPSNVDYRKYLEMFRNHTADLLGDDSGKIPKSVMKTFSIAIEKIESDAAKQLIKLCAFLAPENINCQWFTDADSVLPQPLQDAVKDDYLYQKVKKALDGYSLVKIENNKINMHRLVQEAVKESLKDEQATWINYCIDILDKQLYSDFSTAEARSIFTEMISHILSVTAYPCQEKQEGVANLYFFLGHGSNQLANYDDALNYFQKDLKICEKVFGKEHPNTAASYSNIGQVYRNQGASIKALEYYKKALEICERAFGKEHPDTAASYNNIGWAYYDQKSYAKALDFYQMALDIYEKILGKEHPDTATAYNNIGTVYDNQGDHGKALEYYQKALDIREKALSKEHPDTATSYNNIGGVYFNQGNYAKALKYCKKALDIWEKVLGKEHPLTQTVLENMEAAYKLKEMCEKDEH